MYVRTTLIRPVLGRDVMRGRRGHLGCSIAELVCDCMYVCMYVLLYHIWHASAHKLLQLYLVLHSVFHWHSLPWCAVTISMSLEQLLLMTLYVALSSKHGIAFSE